MLTVRLLPLSVVNFLPAAGEAVVKQPPADNTPLPANTYTLDVVMPNATIPSNAPTTYLCTHVKLPDDKKYQIIAFEVGVCVCVYVCGLMTLLHW